jgi:putative transposase
MFIPANKWVKEDTKEQLPPFKSLRIKLTLNNIQKTIINEWFDTSNYVYNRTIKEIKKGHKINFMSLRDKLVTYNTKKSNKNYTHLTSMKNNITKMITKSKKVNIKLKKNKLKIIDINKLNKILNEYKTKFKSIETSRNPNIKDWELNTPKDIRAGAVDDVCKAYKTGFTNLKNKSIRFFDIHFRKKKDNTSILVPNNMVNFNNNKLILAPEYLKDNKVIKISKNNIKKLAENQIIHDVRIVKKHNIFWLCIPIDIKLKTKESNTFCGIDPGVKTFMTCFGNTKITTYNHNKKIIDDLDTKLNLLKNRKNQNKRFMRASNQKKRRCKKRSLNKIEKRKSNIIDELHWKTINSIINNYDVIFYGDIKSHNIVKDNNNRILNIDINNLKLFTFKQRLLYKSLVNGNKVICVPEPYTTKTCSFCGTVYDIKNDRIFKCPNQNCLNKKHIVDRDLNSAKNILIKGILHM